MPLGSILQNRHWERHEYPFPYVSARNVFTDEYYQKLQTEYRGVLDRGLSEKDFYMPGQFSRCYKSYDAYGVELTKDMGEVLPVFISRHWHDMMAALFNTRGTGYMSSGLHHHLPSSSNGQIHNDFNPVWFQIKGKGRIRLPGEGKCHYITGKGVADNEKTRVVRGVVMLFYINNGDWQSGDGGETGMFLSPADSLNNPAAKIPPVDNSLVMYECTPRSFHSFLKNEKPRNTVIVWTHRPFEEAVEVYGEDNLERWQTE